MWRERRTADKVTRADGSGQLGWQTAMAMVIEDVIHIHIFFHFFSIIVGCRF
jgi:hypothetical protein